MKIGVSGKDLVRVSIVFNLSVILLRKTIIDMLGKMQSLLKIFIVKQLLAFFKHVFYFFITRMTSVK